ncbi:histone deacetylase [Paecilomyces lecythidis]|uniref:Histone deacetylase n=1 Tax=Paecilomyces lecythidis TaxID=3004212 RepID=A0ABR3WPS7_9EURO
MDPNKQHDSSYSAPYAQGASPRGRPSPTSNDATDLSDGLNRLSIRTASATPLPISSPTLSPALSQRSSSQLRQPSPSGNIRTPRKTPSCNSLRDDRRPSTTGLKKRVSSSSLRSTYTGGGPTSPRPSLSRRSSSNLLTSPSATNMRSKSPVAEEPPGTAASIAAEHFQKEVGFHLSEDVQSEALVVIQDACYGHRFSRLRTTQAALDTIVERPERIRAVVLGLSTAYVRIGKRHAGGQFPPHPDLDVKLLPVPPFQIRKTSRSVPLNSAAVTHVHGPKWMDELKTMCDAAGELLTLNQNELTRPRSSGKGGANAPKFHEGDLYLCPDSLDAFQGALGGVCEGVDAVFGPGSTKRAFVCIRPPGHHCSSCHPSGFCWINNVHVGISHAAMAHGLTHAAIIDFDLHHGDGSQAIAWEQNRKAVASGKNAAQFKKTSIGYFSLHDINSYPCENGEEDKVRNASVCIDNAHGQSVWNVHLEPWKTPAQFWRLYNDKYSVLLKKCRDFLRVHTERLASLPSGPTPKAAIFISAGFDASEWESDGMQRHKVNVPTDFYAKFTSDIVRLAGEGGLGVDGRVISVLEGGYSNRALASGVLSHISGLADARSNVSADAQQSGLSSEMIGRLGLNENPGDISQPKFEEPVFDTEWWAPEALEELEALAYPPLTPSKPRDKAPTFFAPTAASVARAVAPARDRRSGGELHIPPPLPEVNWATASHELSKVLIPTHRQTMSCRAEDLKVEPVFRARQERKTGAEGAQTPAKEPGRMQLRERKPKASVPSTPKRPAPKNNRRTTIGDVADLPDLSRGKSPAVGSSKSNRRQSTTSLTSDAPEVQREERARTPSRQVNSRPATATGIKSSDMLGARKTKVSGPRSSTPKRSASPKKTLPPVPKVPAPYLAQHPAVSSVPGEASTLETQRPVSAGGQTDSNDMDSLAAGVRKLNIKLKVPSPEEHAIREKRAAEEQKKTTTKSPKKSAPPKPKPIAPKPAAKTPLAAKSTSDPRSAPAQIKQEPTEGNRLQDLGGVTATQSHSNPPSGPSSPSPMVSGPTMPQMTVMTGNVGKATEGRTPGLAQRSVSDTMSPPLTPGTSQGMPQPQISVHSPPASVTQSKQNLPVFTSTGPIPFAKRHVSAPHQVDSSRVENRPPSSADNAHPHNDRQ